MTTRVRAGTHEFHQAVTAMRTRAGETQREIQDRVSAMLEDIRLRGWEAVCDYSRTLDGREPFEISRETQAAALERCDAKVVEALRRAERNIREYQERLLSQTKEWSSSEGGQVGCLVRGLHRVGLYVPGGTAAYPSSVLMNAVPAKVAGVGEIIMVTPPGAFLSDAVLAAAYIAGVDRVFALGGVQAVAALAYGVGEVPAVDKIVGPGNAYVAAAKRLLYGVIDIDMVAGPSEVLVIADKNARPDYVAADLLSQAEHDTLASAVLISDSPALVEQVEAELARQLALLPRWEIAARSLESYGLLVEAESLEECCRIADDLAPEHLEVMTENPRALLPLLHNAGAIFLGGYTPEPLGDYLAGPSHVLPTSGTARFFSPLSVDSFLKKTSLLEFSQDTLMKMAEDIIILAESEGLDAHARSVAVRR